MSRSIDHVLVTTPRLTAADRRALDRVDEQRRQLRIFVAEPRRWVGRLRRTSLGRAIQGSNSIEGYVVGLDDALAAVDAEDPVDAATETWRAIVGYRNAMTYVLQLAADPHFVLDSSLVRSLHFMMTSYDLRNRPGTWRPGSIFVRDDASGEVVYEGPDADLVPGLMDELAVSLTGTEGHPIVRAAMAHLNLVMIHPFSDGGGRMARCLQSLVLAREGILAPEFSSVEEYLGANTDDYYAVLHTVGRGAWNPRGDTVPWLRFMVTAHYRQGATLLRRTREASALWTLIEDVVELRGVPARSASALFDAAGGGRVRRSNYVRSLEAPISDAAATRDLRQLVDADLLAAHGEKRGRFYLATPRLAELRQGSRRAASRAVEMDPYAPDADPTLF